MALTQEQINQLVKEYKMAYDGEEEVSEEKVLNDLQEYMKDFTDYEDLDEVPFEELIDFIGQPKLKRRNKMEINNDIKDLILEYVGRYFRFENDFYNVDF